MSSPYPHHWGVPHIARHGPHSGSVCYLVSYYVTNRYVVVIPAHWHTQVKPYDKYLIAELVRDKIYQTGCIHDKFCRTDITVSRSVADRIYRQALKYNGADVWAMFGRWVDSRLFSSREWKGVRMPSVRNLRNLTCP